MQEQFLTECCNHSVTWAKTSFGSGCSYSCMKNSIDDAIIFIDDLVADSIEHVDFIEFKEAVGTGLFV